MRYKKMEATRDPVAVPAIESATPNLDAARRGAARGSRPLRQILADVTGSQELGQQEDDATRRVTAFEVRPELREYIDGFSTDLATAFRAMQDPDNFDRGQALSGLMRALTDDIDRIPADYDGPFRQQLIDMYQDYSTKARLATMTDAEGAAELDFDTKQVPAVEEAMERVRTEDQLYG